MVHGCVPPGVEELGAALEMLHTYSLIHDDLPALDNDDLRRGRPTCHKVFGEAIAILAGDGLQTYAYEVLAKLQCPAEARVAIIAEIAHATGTIDGMIGGQVMDLEAEHQHPDAKTLEYIHRSKTGALLTASVVTGGLYAGGDASQIQSLRDFGMNIGLAFQIVDDVLDVTQTSEQLGKTAGKDTATEKATYPSLFGIEASIKKADELVKKPPPRSTVRRARSNLREIAHSWWSARSEHACSRRSRHRRPSRRRRADLRRHAAEDGAPRRAHRHPRSHPGRDGNARLRRRPRPRSR